MIFSLRTAAQHTGAELERVYQPQRMKKRDAGFTEHHAPSISRERNSDAPGATAAILEAEIAGLREILRRADVTANGLRQDRQKWRSLAESEQRLLAPTNDCALGGGGSS